MTTDQPVDPNDVPLRKGSHDLYIRIGEVITWAADLDLAMLMLYIEVAKTANVSDPLRQAQGAGASKLRGLLQAVIERPPHAGTPLASRVAAILSTSELVAEARNHVAHGVWFSYEELDVAVRLRRSGNHDRMSFTANELMNLAVNIKRVELDCVAMFYEITGIGPPASDPGVGVGGDPLAPSPQTGTS
jgi:hypothetical protein